MKESGKKRVLGRGLSALLADKPTPEVSAQAKIIPISRIRPNRFQPRTRFDQEALEALTASVRQEGIIMPVLVRPLAEGYELIAGERRWRAAQAAELLEIPAVVRAVDDQEALELAIIENEQRDDLSPVESARAYQRLILDFSLSQQQVAEKIGVSRSHVSNLLRLLQLPDAVQELVVERKLDMGHVRPLVGLAGASAELLARECVARGWSARFMEREAKHAASAKVGKKAAKERDVDVANLEDELGRNLGLPVQIRWHPSGRGELRIYFSRPAELDGVLVRLRGKP